MMNYCEVSNTAGEALAGIAGGEPRSILICDTQPIAAEGLRGLIEAAPGLRCAGSVANPDAAFELLRVMMPAVVVIDKGFGTGEVVEWLHQLAAANTSTSPVVWGQTISDAEALRLLQAGARGIVRRSSQPETILACLRAVASGQTWMEEGIFGGAEQLLRPRRSRLTAREQEVATLVERGMRNRDIAQSLGIQTGTVKIHLKHIFEKTGVRGRYGLALTGLKQRGALQPRPV
jgi:DNA-binding NarL/FixJ family response regulator